jgi:hypothetical protein
MVRLQALLERDSCSAYQAAIETVDGTAVWSQNGLQPQSVESGTAVVMTFPADFLSNRDYILTLKGQTPAGGFQTAAEYSFLVEKR